MHCVLLITISNCTLAPRTKIRGHASKFWQQNSKGEKPSNTFIFNIFLQKSTPFTFSAASFPPLAALPPWGEEKDET